MTNFNNILSNIFIETIYEIERLAIPCLMNHNIYIPSIDKVMYTFLTLLFGDVYKKTQSKQLLV